MDRASEALLALQPVTFHYKKDLDPEAIPQFGLVAEQVAKSTPTWWREMFKATLHRPVRRGQRDVTQ